MTTKTFSDLRIQQLDRRLSKNTPLGELHPPQHGWIHTIRTALGMTERQLAARLAVSQQAVHALENREAAGQVTVERLRAAAEAMECELILAIVPKDSLAHTIERRATLKAREERNRLVHTMRLEAQDDGVPQAIGEDPAYYLTATRRARLWD